MRDNPVALFIGYCLLIIEVDEAIRMTFPNDDSGDALRRLQASGDDLTRQRGVDFAVVFPNEKAAEHFAQHFRDLGYVTSVETTEERPEFPWDVTVVKHMAPSHEEITAFEDLLQTAAEPLGGHNDGWGCFSEPSAPA